MTLNQLKDADIFEDLMIEIAVSHCQRGVRACEYGIVGEVLFYSLRQVQGPELFTSEAELCWIKVYSAMIRVIVPLAVTYERCGKIDENNHKFQSTRVLRSVSKDSEGTLSTFRRSK